MIRRGKERKDKDRYRRRWRRWRRQMEAGMIG